MRRDTDDLKFIFIKWKESLWGHVTTVARMNTPCCPHRVICKGRQVVLRLRGSRTIAMKRDQKFYVNLTGSSTFHLFSYRWPIGLDFVEEPHGFSLKNADTSFFSEVQHEKKIVRKMILHGRKHHHNVPLTSQDIKQQKSQTIKPGNMWDTWLW